MPIAANTREFIKPDMQPTIDLNLQRMVEVSHDIANDPKAPIQIRSSPTRPKRSQPK